MSSPVPIVHPHYRDRPKQFARDDFWRQVCRTVDGRPVDEGQIQLIVAAVMDGLELQADDVLLDLACGNGALGSHLYPIGVELLGVDYSEHLISIADEYFSEPPRRRFVCQDVAGYTAAEPHPERFTKALCYGSFAYLTRDDALSTLQALSERFPGVSRVFLGNVPDRLQVEAFYRGAVPDPAVLEDPLSAIGIWRSEQEFAVLAERAGWRAEFRRMPAGYYAAHYRYDVVLLRP